MQADDARGDGCGRRQFVDVQIGGVCGQDRVGAANTVEFGEDLPFQVHVFENRLDDDVAVGQRIVSVVCREPGHRGVTGLV